MAACVTFQMSLKMNREPISVKSSAGSYSVLCCSGILQSAAKEIARLGKFSSAHVITSPGVWRALRTRIQRGLGVRKSATLHLMNDLESAKTLRTVESLSRALIKSGADRKSLLIAVGGGVVGDLAGFVAASYLRGVGLIHVPTTLVAQVDSSIGGKTGVNLPEGKNLVGAFYPPRAVLTDPETLRTLPAREFRAGLAEVIKHSVIADPPMFSYLEKNIDKVLGHDKASLEYLIPRNVRIKARVVSLDERESGLREILNFGHTFAHALESITRYRRYRHGEAVAWGMMAAALLGHEIGLTRPNDVSRLVALVRRIGPLPPWPDVRPKSLIKAMRADKKARGGNLRFVLLPCIGKAKSYDDVPVEIVERVLRFAPHFVMKSSSLEPRRHD
jgi:3-dehydroquinate synthase